MLLAIVNAVTVGSALSTATLLAFVMFACVCSAIAFPAKSLKFAVNVTAPSASAASTSTVAFHVLASASPAFVYATAFVAATPFILTVTTGCAMSSFASIAIVIVFPVTAFVTVALLLAIVNAVTVGATPSTVITALAAGANAVFPASSLAVPAAILTVIVPFPVNVSIVILFVSPSTSVTLTTDALASPVTVFTVTFPAASVIPVAPV